jgi:hypothetical protein
MAGTGIRRERKLEKIRNLATFLRAWETPRLAWKAPEPKLASHANGLIVFDLTVTQKKYTFGAAMAHGDGNINSPSNASEMINCIYINPISQVCWVLDHRVLASDKDGKTTLDHVRDMLNKAIRNKATPFSTVLMKRWYATEALMLLIDRYGKAYWCPIRNNRLADDGDGADKYKSVKSVVFGADALRHGKVVKLKSFPGDHPVKLFRIVGADGELDHVATNQLNEDAVEAAQLMGGVYWKTEKSPTLHRPAKRRSERWW